jgi:RNA 2',3'-cyclic 3'-phosphodiesterase
MKRGAVGEPSQMSLGGLAPPQADDRLFFAIFPDADTAARIAALAATLRLRHGLRGKVLLAARLHVTLHHLGDYAGLPPAIVAAATRAGGRLASRRFDVVFDRAASFGTARGKCPFVLRGGDGITGLIELQRELGMHMAASGIGRHVEQRFTPHVTLLYDEMAVDHGSVDPIGWRASEVVLVHSLIGRSEHRILARWMLAE